MAADQDTRIARVLVRKAGAHRTTEPHPARDALDPGPCGRQIVACEIHHPVDRVRVECRAFAFDPWPKSVEHGVDIEGEGVEIHARTLRIGWNQCGCWRLRCVGAELSGRKDQLSGRRFSTMRAITLAPTGRIASSKMKPGLWTGTPPACPMVQ